MEEFDPKYANEQIDQIVKLYADLLESFKIAKKKRNKENLEALERKFDIIQEILSMYLRYLHKVGIRPSDSYITHWTVQYDVYETFDDIEAFLHPLDPI